jgi:hypothetical protein
MQAPTRLVNSRDGVGAGHNARDPESKHQLRVASATEWVTELPL